MMKRRSFLGKAAGLATAVAAFSGTGQLLGAEETKTEKAKSLTIPDSKLKPPPHGRIPVAVAISEGVTVIDFAGPWEVFQDTMIGDAMPFQLFTVSEKTDPIEGSAGLKLVPDHTFANAPEIFARSARCCSTRRASAGSFSTAAAISALSFASSSPST